MIWPSFTDWGVPLVLLAHLGLGLLVGAAFFMGLWRTVRHMSTVRPLLLVASSLGRIALLAAVLLLVGREGAPALLATSLGVIVARLVVVRRLREVRP